MSLLKKTTPESFYNTVYRKVIEESAKTNIIKLGKWVRYASQFDSFSDVLIDTAIENANEQSFDDFLFRGEYICSRCSLFGMVMAAAYCTDDDLYDTLYTLSTADPNDTIRVPFSHIGLSVNGFSTWTHNIYTIGVNSHSFFREVGTPTEYDRKIFLVAYQAGVAAVLYHTYG